MAGGQERILRRRIKSVQSTRKITKAMELIAAPNLAVSGAHHCEPSLSQRHATHHRRSAKADPAGAAKLLATPSTLIARSCWC